MTTCFRSFASVSLFLVLALSAVNCVGPKGGTKGKHVDKSIQVYLAAAGKMQYFVMPQDFKSATDMIVVDITARDTAQIVQTSVLRFSIHLQGVNEKVDTLWMVSDAGQSRAYPEPKAFFKEREDKDVHYRFETPINPEDFKLFMRSQKRSITLKRNGAKTEYVQTKKAKKRFDTASGQMMF